MGAWGAGSFDNDTAMDWAGTFVDADEGMPEEDDDEALTKEALIIGPLATLAESPEDEYIEADLASEAVAAGEIVAAIFGLPSADLLKAAKDPEAEGNTLGQLMAWVSTTGSELKERSDLRVLAREAVGRVLDSELSELWEDSDSGDEWKRAVEDLRKRLA